MVRDGGMRRSQVVEVTAVLTSQVDTLVRVDTLRSHLEVAWSAVPGTAPPRLAGLVTDARSAFGAESLAVPAGLSLPFSFTSEIRRADAQPSFLIPDPSSCTSIAAALVQSVRETWLALPDTLWPERSWQDSSSYIVCRDGVPLTLTSVRTFSPVQARLREGQLVVQISRRTTLQLAGDGLQFGEPVALLGEGEGQMLLEVALVGGTIVRGEGTSELRLEMRGRRRFQRLVQESHLVVREP